MNVEGAAVVTHSTGQFQEFTDFFDLIVTKFLKRVAFTNAQLHLKFM